MYRSLRIQLHRSCCRDNHSGSDADLDRRGCHPRRRTQHSSARPAMQIDEGSRRPTAKVLFGVGALSGFGAGISGAGGPLFSVPLMLGLHFDALVAVGTGQVVQIAAAFSGSLNNWSHDTIQYGLAAPVTAVELIGVAAGVKLAHVAGGKQLRYGAAILCIVSAIGMVAKTIASQ